MHRCTTLACIALLAVAACGDGSTAPDEQDAASVTISPALSEIHALGDSTELAATVRDANGNVIAGADVDWTSTDDAVATVNAAGWVTAQANGTATITATAGGASDEAMVVVEQVVASVRVSPATDTLAQHGTTQLSATVADGNGTAVPGRPVSWTTSDPALATVDNSGNVTATGWGADAVITATAEDVSGTAELHLLDQIAFASGRDGALEVYVMNADGSGQTNLTDDGALDGQPAWSPDGSKIAFTSDRDGDYEVYVMNADGSGQTNISDDGADDVQPVWRPGS